MVLGGGGVGLDRVDMGWSILDMAPAARIRETSH